MICSLKYNIKTSKALCFGGFFIEYKTLFLFHNSAIQWKKDKQVY